MTGFGHKCAQNVHDHQKDIFTTNGNTIQATLESLQESQRNEYFGDKLTTKTNENLRITSLNINGLDFGKGEHSLLQLCLNLQDKCVNLLCSTEINVNWQRHNLVQRFSATLKKAWPKKNISLCTSDSTLPWNSNYKPGGTAIIALGNISSAIISKGEDPHGLGRWTTVTLLGKYNTRISVFNMYQSGDTSIENSGPITVIKQQ